MIEKRIIIAFTMIFRVKNEKKYIMIFRVKKENKISLPQSKA